MGVNETSDLAESIFHDALIGISSLLIRHSGKYTIQTRKGSYETSDSKDVFREYADDGLTIRSRRILYSFDSIV